MTQTPSASSTAVWTCTASRHVWLSEQPDRVPLPSVLCLCRARMWHGEHNAHDLIICYPSH